MSSSAADPAGFSYLSHCLVEPANKSLPMDNGGEGIVLYLRRTCLLESHCDCSGLSSASMDENFLWNVSAVYVSRLPLGQSFGTFPAPAGARSSASHSAPLRSLGSSQDKFENHGKRGRANFFRAPSRKQTLGLGSWAHSLGSAQCDPINNGKIQQTETQ
jgi:hypothetical protein